MSHEELLAEAVALSSEKAFRRDRSGFWRWQRDFMNDKGITDQMAIKDAVDEMADLMRESKLLANKSRIRTGLQYAFMIGSVTLGIIGGQLSPVGIGGAFISVGQFVSDRMIQAQGDNAPPPTALFRDIQKRFGWK